MTHASQRTSLTEDKDRRATRDRRQGDRRHADRRVLNHLVSDEATGHVTREAWAGAPRAGDAER